MPSDEKVVEILYDIQKDIKQDIRDLRVEIEELKRAKSLVKGVSLGVAAVAGFIGSIIKHLIGWA